MSSEFERLQAALPERYTLLREIDQGGMSRVYLAREALPDREVAIKVLDEALSARVGRERFLHEVEVTSKLGHPYIVPIYAAAEARGTLYYVMPYIGGESLRDRLAREGQLPLADATRIALQVADAIQHAHEQGVVHRDIKPANILFQGGHAVVTDFGIARALRAAEAGKSRDDLTQAGTTLGTPDYMSPEQATGEGTIDARTDIYALGCVLYEMLGGQPPFHSRTPQATLARHVGDTLPSLRALRETVPTEVEAVVRRALAKSPADRHASAADFAQALRDATSPATTTAPRATSARPSPFTVPLRLAALLLAVAALGVAWQVWTADPPDVAAAEVYTDSVAIMPFANRTGDAAYDYLGHSIADEVSGHLAAIPQIKVIGSYSVVSLWNQNLGIPRLLDTLDVGHLIDGAFELRGGELVFSVVELDQAGVVRDRTTHTLDPAGLDTLQVALAHEVARAFLAHIGITTALETESDVGYGPGRDAYLAANAWLGQRTPGAMLRAVEGFQEAIRLDPTYAAAHAALSSAYALSLYYRYDVGVPAYGLAAMALASADRAIELNPMLSNGYAARGYIRGLLGIEVDGAEADFARAVELAPNAPNGPSWSTRILAQRGRVAEAFREARRARDLDPFQAGRRIALATLAFELGDLAVALEESREALRLEPQLELARAFEGRTLALLDRGGECLQLEFDAYAVVRALCLHADGREAEARALVDSVEARLSGDEPLHPGHLDELVVQDLASFYAFAGDAQRAAEWVRRAFDLSPTGVDTRLTGSRLFAPVADDAPLAATLAEARELARQRLRLERERLRGGVTP